MADPEIDETEGIDEREDAGAEESEALQEAPVTAPTAASIPNAALLGATGAAIGAAIWVAIAVFADAEVGWIAWGIGALAGGGVLLGAGGARGQTLQITAVACALGGLVIGKYFSFAIVLGNALEEELGQELPFGSFSPEMFELFTQNLGVAFGAFDLLWMALAVGSAWQIPAVSAASTQAAARVAARARRGGKARRK